MRRIGWQPARAVRDDRTRYPPPEPFGREFVEEDLWQRLEEARKAYELGRAPESSQGELRAIRKRSSEALV